MENTNTVKLFDDAFKNVCMGSYAIDCIIDKIEDIKLLNLIRKQNEFYFEITNKLTEFAKQNKLTPKDLNSMLKTSSYVGINLKTLFNKNTSHLAEMLIQGTTMGITTLIKEMNQTTTINTELVELAKEIIGSQEKFVESLKDFL
jgi:hypothetical protein